MKQMMSLGSKMLLGRLLTRSGDQAWDFAVPIVLLQIFPGELRIAALFYLLVKVATVLLLPQLSRVIDKVDRLHAARLGIFL
jgi:iron-regulated transporter 1